MLAALYGGVLAGFLTSGVSAGLRFFWIQRGSMSSVEWLAMTVLYTAILQAVQPDEKKELA
jgi:hypothetical protein